MNEIADVAIVGSGPAGASCAAFCAAAGLRTLLLERETFPREKVCGDCLNPSCWPVLRRLGVAETIRALPHGTLDAVEFIPINGRAIRVALPRDDDREIAVKRSLFDAVLLKRTKSLGAVVSENFTVSGLTQAAELWEINAKFRARFLVAADGRNSTVARLCNLLPRVAKERIGLQTHIPLPRGFGNRVVLQFVREGYSGQAPVGDEQLNLCLVSAARAMPQLRRWAEERFGISPEQAWRTITPLTRAALPVVHQNLFLVGDAAQVVEPFTGEGIYYALRSGELAADAIAQIVGGADQAGTKSAYGEAHRAMYRGRLWVNRLARLAVLSPRAASAVLEIARFQPALLRMLTAKITRHPERSRGTP